MIIIFINNEAREGIWNELNIIISRRPTHSHVKKMVLCLIPQLCCTVSVLDIVGSEIASQMDPQAGDFVHQIWHHSVHRPTEGPTLPISVLTEGHLPSDLFADDHKIPTAWRRTKDQTVNYSACCWKWTSKPTKQTRKVSALSNTKPYAKPTVRSLCIMCIVLR